jgi:hypothetical protein
MTPPYSENIGEFNMNRLRHLWPFLVPTFETQIIVVTLTKISFKLYPLKHSAN